jgi:hypothetical protein
MNVGIPAIVAFLMSSIIAPWFEHAEIPLTAAQQLKIGNWITGAMILGVTLLTHFGHQAVKSVAARANHVPPKQAGRARVGMLALLGALCVLPACALLANPTFDAVLMAVIQAAVSALLNKNPTLATEVQQDATTLAALASGSASAAQLQTQADAVIAASSLPIGDKAAFEDLVAAATDLLQQEAAQIPANAQSGVALVFTDIANAAQLYVSASGNAHIGAVILK